MADEKLPYVLAYGAISKVLEKIKSAATPDRFTQDFLASKLSMKGGNAKATIPFLKRIGFLGTDGAPTERYKRFRNPAASGSAAFEALKQGYKAIFERNENAQDIGDAELKGLVVEASGLEPSGSTVRAILGSYKALKAFAKFDQAEVQADVEESDEIENDSVEDSDHDLATSKEGRRMKFGLSYTINLNLPATSDIAVFNAIFRSIKENLLK